MEIDLLGRFAVRRHGQEIPAAAYGGRLTRRLLRVLAARRGHIVTREALIDALWEDDPPRDPAGNLSVLVNRARHALDAPGMVRTVESGYLLDGGPDLVVDLEQFEELVTEAREALARGAPSAAQEAVRAARALWSGTPLPEDVDARWARPLVERLRRRHLELLQYGATAALATGSPGLAAELAGEAVAADPLREPAHLLLIRARAAGGDVPGALSAYERLRATLAEELGIDPSAEAGDLQVRLLRGEPPPMTGSSSGAALRPSPQARSGRLQLRFLGRERELATLVRLGGSTRVALVAGRSGSGKSRLLAEVADRRSERVLRARAVLPERDAPWSLARALVASARAQGIDPALVLSPRPAAVVADLLTDSWAQDEGAVDDSAPLDPQTRRALVLQSVAALLEAATPATLLLDDVQWADSSSLDLVRLLVERSEECVAVLAFRPDEVQPDDLVARFFAGLRDFRPVELHLGPLPPAAVAEAVDDPAVAHAIGGNSDGSPFAVLEVIRELADAGVLRQEGSGRWVATGPGAVQSAGTVARAGQQRAILARVQHQPAADQEVLRLLALLARPVSAPTLATAAGSDVATALHTLHSLGSADLVRHDARGFSVAHDLVGDTLREALSSVDRARLHQMLARALGDEQAPDEEIARHLAGAGDVRGAATAYAAAARDRLARYADREAEQLADAGLCLEPSSALRRTLLETRAEARARIGTLHEARDDLRTALSLARGGPERSRLLARLAALQSGAENLHRAANLADLAVAEAGDDPSARARALYVAALVDMNLEHLERADDRFGDALRLFTALGDAAGVADILDARAMARFVGGDITGGVEAFGEVVAVFQDSGNLLRVVTPRSTRGHGLMFAGRPVEGVVETAAAVELARSLGYAEGEAMAMWHHSEALTACGRVEESLEVAEQALATAQRVRHRGWTATAHIARGIALVARGDLRAAEAAFVASLEESEHLPPFASWGHAQLAKTLLASGRIDEAARHVDLALSMGSPLSHYEARLARCELAVARADAAAADLVQAALGRAEAGGHRLSADRLRALQRALVEIHPGAGVPGGGH